MRIFFLTFAVKKNNMKKIFILAVFVYTCSTVLAVTQVVIVQNTFFSPSTFTISLGDTVQWTWVNGSHTTTSLSVPAGASAWDHAINSANTSFIYVPADTGMYAYKCTPHFGFGMMAAFDVICPQVAVTISATSSTVICNGSSVNLLSSASGNPDSYQWRKNGVPLTGMTSNTYSASSTGSYSVIATNSCGSSAASNSINVTVNALPPATITPSGPTTFCSGTNPLTLTANSGTGLTYQWKKGSTNISGATNINFVPATTGTYKVKVTNSNGCSRTSAGIAVTVNPLPPATITPSGPTTFCSGTNPLTLTANPGTGLTYQWKKGANIIPGATNQSYVPTATSTSYKVVVTNSNGCSKTSSPVSITVHPLPAASITPLGPTTFCMGDSVTLQANNGTGLAYQWTKGGNNIAGASLQNYTAKTGGNYKVIVTNPNGCSKTSAAVTVTINCRNEKDIEQSNPLNVYPNPSSGLFRISVKTDVSADLNFYVKDLKGSVVFNSRIVTEESAFGENLKPGIYFIELRKGKELIAGTKIIKINP